VASPELMASVLLVGLSLGSGDVPSKKDPFLSAPTSGAMLTTRARATSIPLGSR